MPEKEDKRPCAWIHEQSHAKAGQPCGAFAITDSQFCIAHTDGGTARMVAGRNRRNQAAQDLQENYFELKTRQDVQNTLEKVVNGVLSGIIKKEKGQLLAVFLPLAYKIAKELEGVVPTGRNIKLSMTEDNKTMSIEMSDEQMDAYLDGDENVKIRILEELEGDGKLKISKQKDKPIIDAVYTAEPKDIKIKAGELSQISMKTDVPQTTKQMQKLFGRNLADTPPDQSGPDMTGFGHLFEPGGLPAQSEPLPHKWKGGYEKQDNGLAALWFTCQWCQARAKNVNKEECPTPQYESTTT